MRYVFLLCLLILSACNVPAVNSTADAPVPDPSLIPVGTDTATAIPATGTPEIKLVGEATRTPQATGFSPILYGKNFGHTTFLLLGGVDENGWLAPDAAASNVSEGIEYDIYSSSEHFQITGDIPKHNQTCNAHFVGTDTDIANPGIVGVAQGWQVTQRGVEELSSENEFYKGVVAQWLIDKGMSDPVIENLRVLRVDIEGDGADEVFVSASHFNDETGHMVESGDYTVVLMRKVSGNDAVTFDVIGDVYALQELAMTFPFKYSLANFVDLNQDGNLEVVIEINRWEGFGAAVYEVNGMETIPVLKTVCGE